MSIQKITAVDQIEVVPNGSVQVRTKTTIMENDLEISSSFHRHVVAPGDDYSNQDERVKSICAATHTTEVIEAYKAAIAAQGV
jgi:hypothetical protein